MNTKTLSLSTADKAFVADLARQLFVAATTSFNPNQNPSPIHFSSRLFEECQCTALEYFEALQEACRPAPLCDTDVPCGTAVPCPPPPPACPSPKPCDRPDFDPHCPGCQAKDPCRAATEVITGIKCAIEGLNRQLCEAEALLATACHPKCPPACR